MSTNQCLRVFLVGFFLAVLTGVAAWAELYFPPAGSEWAGVSPESLGWDKAALEDLYKYVEESRTKSFLILKDGKIVVEKHWDVAGQEYAQRVFSTGKSITAFLVGMAQEQDKLKITQAVSAFLGAGWSKASRAQERAVQILHLLKMSSGLDTKGTYMGPPDSIWLYNTEVYHQLHPVLEKAVGTTVQKYAERVLFSITGMTNTKFLNQTFAMTARDMARFGLMILAGGAWNGQTIMKDQDYFQAMLDTSQSMNPAYGYLWWLNGKESFRSADPRQPPMDGLLIPDGHEDLVCAMGKGEQRIYVSPALNLVVVRLGDSTGEGKEDAVSSFDNNLWKKLTPIVANPSAGSENADPYLLQAAFTGEDGIAYFDEAHTLPAWLHPEIRLFSKHGNIDVTDTGINQNGKYYLSVKVHNSGPQPATNVTVAGFYYAFGVSSDFQPFGRPVVIPAIAPGESAEARIHTKAGIAGHVCAKAEISGGGDRNPANNIGQRNLTVEAATPGKTITREMAVVNRALIKQDSGRWKVGPIEQLRLVPRVSITPPAQNTPQNQSLVRVKVDPAVVVFPDTGKVSRQNATIQMNFDRKLPAGITVHVLVQPVSPDGKLLMDGCSWQFNVTRKRVFQTDGGM